MNVTGEVFECGLRVDQVFRISWRCQFARRRLGSMEIGQIDDFYCHPIQSQRDGSQSLGRFQKIFFKMVGLGAKWHKRPEELSGGEQQRVAVVLALANDPSLILADEPTGNLDTGNTETITALFLSLAENFGKTVIMASHDPKAVEHFKKVYNLRDGKFV